MREAGSAMQTPYQHIARFYDALYAAKGRDPNAEVDCLARYWNDDGLGSGQRSILDAACGTGVHLAALGTHGRVEGLDRSRDMLLVARRNHPDVVVHEGDLETFVLNRQFNVVTCLFGAAGYLPNRAALRRAIATMGAHVAPGGVLLIEPPVFREQFQAPKKQRIEAPFENGVLIRESDARLEGSTLEIDFDWRELDADGQLVKQVIERHQLLVLEASQWHEDAQRALPTGAAISLDNVGLGRGLLIARISPSGVRGSG